MDTGRLRASFRRVQAHGDNFALFFYGDLFLRDLSGDIRKMFPASMKEQREHLLKALSHIVSCAGDPGRLAPYLSRLGVTHRGFGVLHDGGHYEAVAVSLLAALAHFEGENWTDEVAQDWGDAYGLISQVMRDAARGDEKRGPAEWAGTITSCVKRAHAVHVLQVRVEPGQAPLDYLPGQSVPVQIPAVPREWKRYAVACPPRADGLLEFHVRVVGPVSRALAMAPQGTRLYLRPAGGEMTLRDAARPALMAAESTGLAPLLAIIGQLALTPAPPPVSLYWGAQDAQGLYLWRAVAELEQEYPWLTLRPVVAAAGGHLPDVVIAGGPWGDRDAYVAGAAPMAGAVTAALAAAGMPDSQIVTEAFG